MTKTEILDILSKKDLTFRQIELVVGSAITILRTEIIRKRIIALPVTPTSVHAVVAATAFNAIGRPEILAALQSALAGSPSSALAVAIIDAMFNAYGDLDDVPLRDLPEVAIHIEQAHLYHVATIAGGSDGWVSTIAKDVGSPLDLLGPALAEYVDSAVLAPQVASAIGLAATLYEAVDRELAIAQAIRSAPLVENGNQPASSSLDLARLTPERWLSVLVANNVVPRAGTTRAELAARLADRFSMLHPGTSFTARLRPLTAAQIKAHLVTLQPLFDLNTSGCCVFPFEQLDITGIPSAQLASIHAAHAALRAAILIYPGLELEESIDDGAGSAASRSELVALRIAAVHQVITNERETFLRFDYDPRSDELDKLPLDALGISVAEQRLVLRTLKSYQRVYAITGSVSDSERAMLGGFASARAIAAVDPAAFAALTSIEAPRAQQIHARALDLAGDAAVTVGALLDAVREPFAETTASNLAPSAIDYLRKIDGFEQLFGSLSFCKCQACSSILGPAAYFVDLMKFIDERIRVQFPPTKLHALDLKERRSDLWSLKLNCGNTNERIPLLQIVDEILEAYIVNERALPGDPEDQRKQVYVDLATADGSFQQPFHRPLAQVESYLAHLDGDRAAIASALESAPAVWADARLGLSPKMRALVTTQDLVLAHHRTRYGVDFQVSGTGIAPVDVQGVLLPKVPLDRDELDALIGTSFVRDGGAAPHIVAEKRTPESVQNDVENLHGLTVDALDRMHRMIRLRQHVPWTFAELDRAMTSLGIVQLDTAAIDALAKLREVQLRFAIECDEASALVGSLPDVLLDRVFNDPAAVAADGELPQPTRVFVHPAFRAAPASANPAATRLAAALGTTMSELELLIRGLRDYLTRPVETPPDDPGRNGFLLSEPNLRLLYRYMRLARLLGITIPQLVQLARSAALPAPISSADAVLKLIEVDAWRRAVGYRVEDIATRTQSRINGVEDGDPDPEGAAARIVVGAAEALTFQATLFAVALGVTESVSAAVIAQNPALFSPFGARWRIADGVDLGTIAIAIPDNAVVAGGDGVLRAITAAEIRAVLFEYRGADLILRRLASALAIDVAKLKAIGALAGTNLDTPAITQQLLEERAGSPLVGAIVPLVVFPLAFQSSLWDAGAIDHVRQHAAAYAISTSPLKLTLTSLRALAFAESLMARYVNSESTSSEDLRTVIESFVAAPASNAGFPVDQNERISQLLRIDLAQVTSLVGRIAPGPSALLTLEALSRAARLATELGIDGDAFTALLSSNYDDLSRGADALLAAVRARYPEEGKRADVLAQLDQPLLEQRRDALADLIVRSLRPDVFSSVDDLSSYFLVDVQAGGCQSTSRVIAATSAAQLYVHRVIMRLEQDGRDPSDPLHLDLRLDEEAIEEWAWRKNYRVWEANRKVFLWPESYLEPDLRDDKTPLFAELEQTLLQGDVNEQTVLDAYSKYLAGFEELASLQIAGAYHDVSRNGEVDRDVLHLFGVSNTEPPTYYYRTCEDLLASTRSPTKLAAWTPWRKINVQISGRRVAPIVYDGRLHLFWTDTKTRSRSLLVNGANEFDGYQHTMRMRFTTLRLDGSWAPPQELLLPSTGAFSHGRGVILDRLDAGVPWLDDKLHDEAIDDYTLQGVNWDGCWPEAKRIGGRDVLMVRYRDFLGVGEVDLFGRELRTSSDISHEARPQILCARGSELYYGSPIVWFWGNNAMPNLVLEEKRLDVLDREGMFKVFFTPGLYTGKVATLAPKAELLAIPGNVEDAIVQVGSDVIALQGSITADNRYVARRIGTTLASQVARILFSDGVDGLLDLETQRALLEAGLPLTPVAGQVVDLTERERIDFTGPYGAYYREIFFHIPSSIANHLNGQGQFAAAQRWYQHIFNPTSTEVIQVPSSATPAEREKLLRDRVWRYLELRGLAGATVRDILTDPAALASYRRNPFNPHAIARLRLTAYQKAIVMKYVDNLLDWGDHLFTQFTMESVTEALLLYLTAADILGRRPAELGACGEVALPSPDYEHISPLMDGPDDLLIELETWLLGGARHVWRLGGAPASMRFHAERTALERATKQIPLWSTGAGETSSSTTGAGAHRSDWNAARVTSWAPPLGGGTTLSGSLAGEAPVRST
ncbi:MAG: neuraminidase-like domain-containing protein, partial [Kofleriaceae bacterium]